MAGSFLSRESTVAPPDYPRILVPPAALAVHLAIGQVYAFSVFNLPLSKLIGIDHSAPGDWNIKEVVWTFSIAIAILGLSAALFGRWVERVGPRKSMFVAALCFGGGFIVAAMGVHYHVLLLIYFGYGVLGGCGLGIGYISPVSTLIKWFPDRPGLATGLAIMGFGGGALIAAPLSVKLMEHFKTATSNGVLETFVTMGVIYFMYMMIGVYNVRVPAPGWKPAGWTPPATTPKLVTQAQVAVDQAWRTPQFWLLWVVLCMNVTAGIGVLGQASPMIQEIFAGRVNAQTAAAFVGLLSLFNLIGRFAWASTSDYIGRRNTYFDLLRPRDLAVFQRALARAFGLAAALCRRLRDHLVHVRRRLRDHSGVSARHVRHDACRRHPRPVVDRVGGGGRRRPEPRHLHPRVSVAKGSAQGTGVFAHHVHHVHILADRPYL